MRQIINRCPSGVHGRLVNSMDLAEQFGVARHRKRQSSHMSEERHPRRAVFVEKVPDHAWKHIDRVRARPLRIPSFRGYAAKRCHAKFLQHLSSSHEYAGRPTETLRRPIGANVGSVGRLADPSRSLLSAARTRATYRNRSHSSLFDEVVLEHIMNKVNQKKLPLACAIPVASNRRPPMHERLDGPIGERQPPSRSAGQEREISSISAP